MNNVLSAFLSACTRLWHISVMLLGIAVLTLWLATLWLERMLGELPPLIVAALPQNYHRVLISMAATTVRAKNAMRSKTDDV